MNALNRLVSLVLPESHTRPEGPHGSDELEETIDDVLVNATVKLAVYRDPGLRAAGIHVATCRNVVQLSGFVRSRSVMARAMEAARAVRGVRAVRNDMRLR